MYLGNRSLLVGSVQVKERLGRTRVFGRCNTPFRDITNLEKQPVQRHPEIRVRMRPGNVRHPKASGDWRPSGGLLYVSLGHHEDLKQVRERRTWRRDEQIPLGGGRQAARSSWVAMGFRSVLHLSLVSIPWLAFR